MATFAAQRGTGLPDLVYNKNLSFAGPPLKIAGRDFSKGLGCAANTVLLYDLHGDFDRFESTIGVDDAVVGKTNPPPSVLFTVFVDGRLRFESGPTFAATPPRDLKVDVRGGHMLMLRISCNWDDQGNSKNDYGDWGDARLIGKRTELLPK